MGSTEPAAGGFLVKMPHKGEAAPGSLDSSAWMAQCGAPTWDLSSRQGVAQGPLVCVSGPSSSRTLWSLQRADVVSACATAGDDQIGNGNSLLCSLSPRGHLLSPECHCVPAKWVVPLVRTTRRH